MAEQILSTDSILTRVSKHLANTLEATELFTHNEVVNIKRFATDDFDGYPAVVITPYNAPGARIAVFEDQRNWKLTVNIWQEIDTKGLKPAEVAISTQRHWDKLTDTIVASAQAIDNSTALKTDPGVLEIGTAVLQPFSQLVTGAGVKILASLEIEVLETVDRDT